jgi:hypothetical protein
VETDAEDLVIHAPNSWGPVREQTGTLCGLDFGKQKGWGPKDVVIEEPDEVGKVNCRRCLDRIP